MTLTKDMIANPALWRLSIEIAPQAIDVIINTPLEDHALIYRRFAPDPALAPLAAFEEIIYDNPLLLSDFKQADILVNSSRFAVVPEQVKSEELQADILQAVWPDPKMQAVANKLPFGESLLFGVDQGLVSFIRRTFLDSQIQHPLAVLASYFGRKSLQGNSAKIYARVRPGAVDILAFSRSKLLALNTIETPTIADAAYYILAVAQQHGLDLQHDEFFVYGDTKLREEAMSQLRLMARYVMPVIFPSELFKAGKEALDVPFELIILPLCA